MTFLWPWALLVLLLVPVGILAYQAVDRRRRTHASAAGFGLDRAVTKRPRRLRDGIPAVLYVVGFLLLAFGLSRPQATIAVPREEGIVILAFDVSGSMAATDLQPTRMDAAKAAATDFVQNQPPGVVIGVVAFSDSGLSVQTPTSDQTTVLAAISHLTPQKGTSLAQGIQASLQAIQVAQTGTPPAYYSNRSPSPTPTPPPQPVAPGSSTSAAIVLLTDGENNEDPDPVAAAQAAAGLGVRIDTVGIGTTGGTNLDLNGFTVHTALNEPLLQLLAQTTNGSYYHAADAAQLKSVYDNLDPQLTLHSEPIEVTALFAGSGLTALLLGAAGSLLWLGRLP